RQSARASGVRRGDLCDRSRTAGGDPLSRELCARGIVDHANPAVGLHTCELSATLWRSKRGGSVLQQLLDVGDSGASRVGLEFLRGDAARKTRTRPRDIARTRRAAFALVV